MFRKRLLAYIIDILIVGFIISFVSFLIPNSHNVENLNNELINITENYVSENIDFSSYINQYASTNYSIEREMFLFSLIGVVISILYFVVFPLYNDGQSFGKKRLGIKIVSCNDESVSANGLVIRYLLMDGIGVSILSMCFIFIFKDLSYFISRSILSFLQFLVVIVSVFMVIYRRDFRSLPDLVAGTKVIEVKK